MGNPVKIIYGKQNQEVGPIEENPLTDYPNLMGTEFMKISDFSEQVRIVKAPELIQKNIPDVQYIGISGVASEIIALFTSEYVAYPIRNHPGQDVVFLKVWFENASTRMLTPSNPTGTTLNYFLGNNSTEWSSGLINYYSLMYQDIYPNIDLIFYSSASSLTHGNPLKYEFITDIGGQGDQSSISNQIQMRFELLDQQWNPIHENWLLKTESNGSMLVFEYQNYTIYSDEGLVAWVGVDGNNKQETQQVPITWKISDSCMTDMIKSDQAAYEIDDNSVKSYCRNLATSADPVHLIIDPLINFSTYIGGNDDDWGADVTVDNSGNIYLALMSNSSYCMATSGAYNTTWSGKFDLVVCKLDPSGKNIIYCTFLGGSEDDYVSSVNVDDLGNVYISGFSSSGNYPTTLGALNETYNLNCDGIVTKLNSDGSSLIYSTYIGGSALDNGFASYLKDGSLYLVGHTQSADFPTTPGAYDPNINAGSDGIICKLNATGNGLNFSTHFGADNGVGGCIGITVDQQGYIYCVGGTYANNLPTVSPYQSYQGSKDGFIVKMYPDGGSISYCTYLGGSNNEDQAYGVVVDNSGCAYVWGWTQSTNFPAVNALHSGYRGGLHDGFLTKFNSAGNGVSYSTYLGGNGDDGIGKVLLEENSRAIIFMSTTSTDCVVTSGAYNSSNNGQWDCHLGKLSSAGNSMIYATYLGGLKDDQAYSEVLDKSGNLLLTGSTYSSNFPTTPGCFNDTLSGTRDGFLLKTFSMNATMVTVNFTNSSIYEAPPSFDIDFSNLNGLDDAYYQVDANVPSGSDPTNWTSIHFNDPGRENTSDFTLLTSIWNNLTEGQHYLYLKYWSDLGIVEESKGSVLSFVKDLSPPNGSISINQGKAMTNGQIVNLTVTYYDNGSGVASVRYSNDGVFDTEPWESLTTIREWTLTAGEEVKTVYYQVKDNYNRTSTIYSDTIYYDPNMPGIIYHSLFDQIYENAMTIDIDFGDTGGLDAIYYKINDTSPVGNNTSGWTLVAKDIAGNSYSTDFLLNATVWNALSDGYYACYFKVIDNATNINEGTSTAWTFYKDIENPYGAMIINDGDSKTTSEDVHLDLTFFDTGSGVDLIRLSNDGVFDTEGWESPINNRAWKLTAGAGKKTVFYQVQDKFGRLSPIYSTEIQLESPTQTNINPWYEEPWIWSAIGTTGSIAIGLITYFRKKQKDSKKKDIRESSP